MPTTSPGCTVAGSNGSSVSSTMTGVAVVRRRGRRQHEQPARRDDGGAERDIARVDKVHSHAGFSWMNANVCRVFRRTRRCGVPRRPKAPAVATAHLLCCAAQPRRQSRRRRPRSRSRTSAAPRRRERLRRPSGLSRGTPGGGESAGLRRRRLLPPSHPGPLQGCVERDPEGCYRGDAVPGRRAAVAAWAAASLPWRSGGLPPRPMARARRPGRAARGRGPGCGRGATGTVVSGLRAERHGPGRPHRGAARLRSRAPSTLLRPGRLPEHHDRPQRRGGGQPVAHHAGVPPARTAAGPAPEARTPGAAKSPTGARARPARGRDSPRQARRVGLGCSAGLGEGRFIARHLALEAPAGP